MYCTVLYCIVFQPPDCMILYCTVLYVLYCIVLYCCFHCPFVLYCIVLDVSYCMYRIVCIVLYCIVCTVLYVSYCTVLYVLYRTVWYVLYEYLLLYTPLPTLTFCQLLSAGAQSRIQEPLCQSPLQLLRHRSPIATFAISNRPSKQGRTGTLDSREPGRGQPPCASFIQGRMTCTTTRFLLCGYGRPSW